MQARDARDQKENQKCHQHPSLHEPMVSVLYAQRSISPARRDQKQQTKYPAQRRSAVPAHPTQSAEYHFFYQRFPHSPHQQSEVQEIVFAKLQQFSLQPPPLLRVKRCSCVSQQPVDKHPKKDPHQRFVLIKVSLKFLKLQSIQTHQPPQDQHHEEHVKKPDLDEQRPPSQDSALSQDAMLIHPKNQRSSPSLPHEL